MFPGFAGLSFQQPGAGENVMIGESDAHFGAFKVNYAIG
jgi:hypothetical protein